MLPAGLLTFIRSRVVGVLGIGLLVPVLVIGFKGAGMLEFAELAAYDLFLRLRPVAPVDSRIVLVTVSEADIYSQGMWPLTDAIVDRLLQILLAHKPCAVGLDLYRDIPVPPGTAGLDRTFQEHANVVVPMKFGGETVGIHPPQALKDTDQVGFIDVVVDPGGVVRRGLLFLDDGQNSYYSFALRLALLYAGERSIVPQPDPLYPDHLRLGRTTIRPLERNYGGYVKADVRGYQFLLDYKGAPRPFPHLSLTDVLTGNADLSILKNKIVIVGTAAEGVKDFFFTPFSRGLTSDQQVPGVALHGHIVSQLLRFALDGAPTMSAIGNQHEKAWILLFGVCGAIVGMRVRSLSMFSLIGLLGLVLLSITAYLLLLASLWFPFLPPTMAWFLSLGVVSAYVATKEKRDKAILMHLFSKHVSSELARTIWDQREQFVDGGRPKSQKLTVTVIFTDLQGFTSHAERMNPQAMMDWLNLYQEAMANQVMKHGGVIDDYAGDGLKADFGIPARFGGTDDDIKKDVTNAVECALDMELEVDRLNGNLLQQGLPALFMRVGVFTGPALAGCVGSAERLKYTTVGDTVNVASRLESFDRALAPMNGYCRILIGETTRKYLGENYVVEGVGDLMLKGKTQTIRAYRLVGRKLIGEQETREVS